jgi:hypothetical protein
MGFVAILTDDRENVVRKRGKRWKKNAKAPTFPAR